MSTLSIAGYGDQLTVNGIRIGDLSTADHETIEKEKRKQINIKLRSFEGCGYISRAEFLYIGMSETGPRKDSCFY